MELKQPLKAIGTVGVTAAAGLIAALALTSPAQAEENTTIHLKEQHKETTAVSDAFEQLCGEDEHIPADKPDDYDGWVFNYPGSKQYGTEILVLTAEFRDLGGDLHILDTDNDGHVIETSGALKAYIEAPTGWTLVDAEALLKGADHTWNPTFLVTHACPGEPGDGGTTPEDGETSPGEESPSEESPTPGGESSTVPGEASTSPAGSTDLPVTGTPLTIALVSAAALAAAGAALFMLQRRRREAQDW